MKRKILSLFLCSMMLSSVVYGCESKENNINDKSVSTEAAVMPDEVKAKVRKAAFMESVPIPENMTLFPVMQDWTKSMDCSPAMPSKKVSESARIEMEKFLDKKVFLTTYVKVKEDWRNSAFLLKEHGYGER